MVRHAARLIRNGELGRIRFVAVEHASGWAATPLELDGHRQARWRTDPDIAGFPSVVADLGTHALHLLRYVTGLEATRISAELSTLVPGRRVFDNATARLTLSNGAPATLWASMAATGHEHGLRIRVFGDTASLEWRHEDPHHLMVRDLSGGDNDSGAGHELVVRRCRPPYPSRPGTSRKDFSRHSPTSTETWPTSCGHAATASQSWSRELSIPTGIDGLIGVQFVEAAAASHAAEGAWVVPAFAGLAGRCLTCSDSR